MPGFSRKTEHLQQASDQRLRSVYLVLFMTAGMSLAAWDRGGHLNRELAIYRRLRPHVGGIAIVSHGGADDLGYEKDLPGIDVLVSRGSNRWTERSLARQLTRLAAGRRLVLKTNQLPGSDLAVAVASRLHAPLIARNGYLHAEFAERRHGPDHPEAIAARTLENKTFSAATRVVVTTPAMRESVRRSYGLPAEKVIVVPNYVDTDLFAPLPEVSPIPGRVGFVGRLAPQKNLHALLEGLQGFSGELVLVGDGELREELSAISAASNLPVQFVPSRPNSALPEFLRSCSAFILPSLYEGHPKALLEAMSTGLACVGAATPGIAELIEDGVDGLLVPPNPPNMRSALDQLINNSRLAQSLGEAARRKILTTFSLQKVLAQELAVIATVAASFGALDPSINGDGPVDQGMRRQYLAFARGQIGENRKATASLPPRLTRKEAERARCGDSPLRIYSDAILARALMRLPKRPVAVLDVGCGRGHYADFLRQHGVTGSYLGIDVEARPDWTRYAGADHGLEAEFRQGAIEIIDLPEERFDFVFSSSALEHIEDDARAIQRMFAATRPGGVGLHLVPAPASIFLYGYHGWRRYAAPSLRALFETAGFQVEAVQALGGLPSFVVHALIIGTLESGMTPMIIHDWIRKGGPYDKWRTRAATSWFPQFRQSDRGLGLYSRMFRLAHALDRRLPKPTSGYAVTVRRAPAA